MVADDLDPARRGDNTDSDAIRRRMPNVRWSEFALRCCLEPSSSSKLGDLVRLTELERLILGNLARTIPDAIPDIIVRPDLREVRFEASRSS